MRLLGTALFLLSLFPLMAGEGTKLTVQINAADTGKPIDRASVIVNFKHGLNPVKMKKLRTNWETKTSQEGTVSIPEIPMGEVTIRSLPNISRPSAPYINSLSRNK